MNSKEDFEARGNHIHLFNHGLKPMATHIRPLWSQLSKITLCLLGTRYIKKNNSSDNINSVKTQLYQIPLSSDIVILFESIHDCELCVNLNFSK